jgi:hypothetical protein
MTKMFFPTHEHHISQQPSFRSSSFKSLQEKFSSKVISSYLHKSGFTPLEQDIFHNPPQEGFFLATGRTGEIAYIASTLSAFEKIALIEEAYTKKSSKKDPMFIGTEEQMKQMHISLQPNIEEAKIAKLKNEAQNPTSEQTKQAMLFATRISMFGF